MRLLMKMFHKNQIGFTLVELMVVIVIIGILVAIAIPVFGGMQERARENTCAANVRILQGAISMYFAEAGKYPAALNLLWDGDPANNVPAFVEEEPLCPDALTESYNYDASTGVVSAGQSSCNHN